MEVFSQQDDYIADFEFTPIHIAVLEIYKSEDLERPTLQQYAIFSSSSFPGVPIFANLDSYFNRPM